MQTIVRGCDPAYVQDSSGSHQEVSLTLAPTRKASARAAFRGKLDDPAVVASLVTLPDHTELAAIADSGNNRVVARERP